jgi:hypothetical protein
MNHKQRKIEEAKEEAYRYVRDLADVNGIGVTWHEELCTDAIQVNLVRATTKALPSHFGGFPVIYRVVGEIDIEDW